jgi:predicted RNA binding protein YcfA (HicA-like mRNA interferase family)
MPPKIRQLKASLLKAGFTIRAGKGSHTVWHHPALFDVTVTLSGNDGKDAKPYQHFTNPLEKSKDVYLDGISFCCPCKE